MEQILRFVLSDMPFLWSAYRYRITHSDVANHMGGWAEMHVESGTLRLVFTFERSQLSVDAVSLFDESRSRIPLELVCAFLGARPEPTNWSGPATPLQKGAYSDFLRDHFETIEAMYSEARWGRTLDAINDYSTSQGRHGRSPGRRR